MLKRLRTDPISSLFFEGKKNKGLFCLILFCSLVAVLLEGASFSALLIGLSSLSGGFSKEVLLKFPYFSFLMECESQTLFLIFILLAVVLQIAQSGFAYLGQLTTTYLTVHVQAIVQNRISQRILHLSYPCVSAYKTGDLVNHVCSAPTCLVPTLDNVNRVIVGCLMLGGYATLMLLISSKLTCVMGTLFILFACLQKILIKKITKVSINQAICAKELDEIASQDFGLVKLIHIFHAQTKILRKFQKAIKKTKHFTFKINKWNGLITPINDGIKVSLTGLGLIAGFFVLKNHTSLPLYPRF